MVADGHMKAPRGVRRSTPNVAVDAGIRNGALLAGSALAEAVVG